MHSGYTPQHYLLSHSLLCQTLFSTQVYFLLSSFLTFCVPLISTWVMYEHGLGSIHQCLMCLPMSTKLMKMNASIPEAFCW